MSDKFDNIKPDLVIDLTQSPLTSYQNDEDVAGGCGETSQFSSTPDDTENSSLNSPISDNFEEILLEKDSEFSETFDIKRKELDKIQDDLNVLMDRLNNFITDTQDDEQICEDGSSVDMQNCDEDLSEKQDGPQEKELMKQKHRSEIDFDELYTSDGANPPEINWDVLAPFIQNVVGDLKRIRNLNQMTSSVLQRIRNITGVVDNNVVPVSVPEEN